MTCSAPLERIAAEMDGRKAPACEGKLREWAHQLRALERNPDKIPPTPTTGEFEVWAVFISNSGALPAGVFSSKEAAEHWGYNPETMQIYSWRVNGIPFDGAQAARRRCTGCGGLLTEETTCWDCSTGGVKP